MDASRSALLLIMLRQFMVMTRRFFFCGRSNTDELSLEFVDFAFFEGCEELLGLLAALSDICWFDLGLLVKRGLKVGESDSRVIFSFAMGS